MKFKRFLAVTLILCILFSLSSCFGMSSSRPPTIDYIYNTQDTHKAIGEYIQAALGVAGLKVNLSNQEWNTFLNTRKNGDYTMARNGWVADYSDPISFLDMWTTSSGNNDVGFGRGAHREVSIYDLDLTDFGFDINVENGTWAETYDRLIEIIKNESDEELRYKLMHKAEDMLMSTGCIVPIYYNTDVYMADKNLSGFLVTAMGYKIFTNSKFGEENSISVCLASEPDTLDPALNSSLDGSTMLCHLFSGLAKWVAGEDGTIQIVADCAKELTEGVLNSDGSVTYTYEIREGAMWSDGKPLTAYDFEYAWRRAASKELAADYGYMFEAIKGYGEELWVSAEDERTLSVTLTGRIPYWNELLAFPTFFPVREDTVRNEGWATSSKTYIGNGPYRMEVWEHDSRILLTKNENYFDKDNVTMENINFFLSDDANNALTNFQSGDWQLIDNLPSNEIKRLERDYPEEYYVSGLIGTYYLCWNINESILPKDSALSRNEAELAMQEIRRAISLLIDRNYICEYIGQAGQVPASSFVAMGFKNPDGTEFYQTAGYSSDYYGYYDISREAFGKNTEEALDILKKYFTLDIDYPKSIPS